MYRVPECTSWFKFGVALNLKNRKRKISSRGIYGDLISAWEFSTRRNAVLVETSILRDPSLGQPEGKLGHLEDKAGFLEIRFCEREEELLERIVVISNLLEQPGTNWAKWCLEYIPYLRQWEEKRLLQIASDIEEPKA